MAGNVWQWTSDCWTDSYEAAPANPCILRVYRGGGWYDGPWLLRPSMRNLGPADGRSNGVGFRLAADR